MLLDFTATRKILPEGMLLIVAELDRAMRMGRTDQQVGCALPPPKSEEARIVREVLIQIGLLHRIGHAPAPTSASDRDHHETVRHWRYATGTRVDEEPGDVLEAHEGRIASSLMTSVQVGLSEALLNSLHHAYRVARADGCARFKERRWWMFTNERNGTLSVIVCDLGIGIPRSLPLTWDRKLLKLLGNYMGGRSPDVAAIRMALILGESSTGDEHRGKGLPQVWNATRTSSAGGVGILSGKAYVGSDSDGEYESTFSTSMLGTMVAWTVPVEASVGKDG